MYQFRVSSQEWEEEECVSKVGDRWDSPRASMPGNLQSQLLSSKVGTTRLGPASREEGWGYWVREWLLSTLVNLVPPVSEKVEASPENTLALYRTKMDGIGHTSTVRATTPMRLLPSSNSTEI